MKYFMETTVCPFTNINKRTMPHKSNIVLKYFHKSLLFFSIFKNISYS